MTLKCLYLRELEEMVREADNDNDGLINCQGDTHLGTADVYKTDEFSEKFQTAFEPSPSSFSENMLQFYFFNFMLKKPCPKSAT